MVRKPPPLRAGDVVGVIAPAGAVDTAALEGGVAALQAAGLRVRVAPHALRRTGYLAGSDVERAADLTAMLADPEVHAVIAARGGYGAGRLLPLIEPATVGAAPKIFVGHSDVTFLLNAFVQDAHVVTFHGPMVTGLPHRPVALDLLLGLLGGDRAGWTLTAPEVIRPGVAEGVLAGGCLAIVTAMLGTPHAIDTRGRLLFLEDVNERPFRVDRMLTHLRQAGAFDDVAGVIFGEMVGCCGPGDDAVTVRDVVAEAFADAPFPVTFGLPSGHGVGTLTLPLGVRARMDGATLTLLESPVAE